MDEENKNVFSLVHGGATGPQEDEDTLPVNTYRIVDVDNDEYIDEGFLIFTQTHVAIMRETEKGALPILLVPLDRVRYAEIVDDED